MVPSIIMKRSTKEDFSIIIEICPKGPIRVIGKVLLINIY